MIDSKRSNNIGSDIPPLLLCNRVQLVLNLGALLGLEPTLIVNQDPYICLNQRTVYERDQQFM